MWKQVFRERSLKDAIIYMWKLEIRVNHIARR